MPSIVIRLHPDKAVDPNVFTTYLQNLQIQAFDISFGAAKIGAQAGQTAAFFPAAVNPPFPLIPPPLGGGPPDFGANAGAHTGIVQQYAIEVSLPPLWAPVSLATAVIEVPATGYENLRLAVSRGAEEIDAGGPFYNVVLDPGSLTPDQFQYSSVTSLYLALPAPVTAANAVYLTLPSDGSPPEFDQLLTAVNGVLGVDPGGAALPDLGTLTPDQCRNIAYEIVWSPQPPLPAPPDPLSDLYDDPPNQGTPSDQNEQDRKQFEGALTSYYATPNATADRLAKWVYALAAAFACQEESQAAGQALFAFPVRPAQQTTAPVSETEVLLVPSAPANQLAPSFGVPAAYFYALGASMPAQVPPDQRYRMACGDTIVRLLAEFTAAFDSGLIGDSYQVGAGPAVNPAQAARRLSALVMSGAAGTPQCAVTATLQPLINDWLAYPPPPPPPAPAPPVWKSYQPGDDVTGFWPAEAAAQPAAFLELVLCALTQGYVLAAGASRPPAPPPPPGTTLADEIQAFLATITAPPTVTTLANVTAGQWTSYFQPTTGYLPPFTRPGNQASQIAAFIRLVQKFFEVAQPALPGSYTAPAAGMPAVLALPSTPWLEACLKAYQGIAGGGGIGTGLDLADLQQAATAVFAGDAPAQAWAVQALQTLDELWALANAMVPKPSDPLAFSIIEALYARGLANLAAVQDLPLADLQHTLTGTIAYDYATAISQAAHANPQSSAGPQGPFVPVNPDGSLTDCIPPARRSPLGPVAYLHEMLKLSEAATCESPAAPPPPDRADLGDTIADRRGPVTAMLASRANLETPIPLIDIVNECLENVASSLPATAGAVYDTAPSNLAGHQLCREADCCCPPADDTRPCHDPAVLFAALPENSSPATPVAQPNSYEALRGDFSAPGLPYSQPLDVSRSYLRALGGSRLAAMRAFREHITEFALDPALPPPGFQTHLWRYPLRLELTAELLGLAPEEFNRLFQNPGALPPWNLYGFPSQAAGGVDWTQAAAVLSEFLKRTGLTYCELVELQHSGLAEFRYQEADDGELPDCEPCCPEDVVLDFGPDPAGTLVLLATFIRLWRALQRRCGDGYSFDQLADIYAVLGGPAGGLNSEFIRQLGALEVLRRDFHLPLHERKDPQPGATGADRTHLLALWEGTAASKWGWAVGELHERVQEYARTRHRGARRPPVFAKLLKQNLDPLSRLAGFDPGNAPDSWHARPTCTLRFAEVLAKICASHFGIGEILYLFTADQHVDGDDPFPLQTQNEALDLPFGLPEDERKHSLWALRERLLSAEIGEDEAAGWTWARIRASLREDFGYAPPAAGPDPLASLGQHFFPSVLAAEGIAVSPAQRWYRVTLAGSSAPMWNIPPGGPFHYDDAPASELSAQLPLTDEEVIAKLAGIRQLNPSEAKAAQDLYFLPRVDLAAVAFLFPDLIAADRHLIQERDEAARWAYFRRHFALARARCRIIAEHLSRHVARVTRWSAPDGPEAAWQVLKHLFADENQGLTPWESDEGGTPAVTWKLPPAGGAFAALLGLAGTGLVGEFTSPGPGQPVLWREVGGVPDMFGRERNERNTAVPTVLPAIDLSLPPGDLRFVALQNGYALRDRDGRPLGGAQGFAVRWKGVLLVEQGGRYRFLAGAPTQDGERPDFDAAEQRRWRVTLGHGQRTRTVLNHQWPDEQEGEVGTLRLERGAHEIFIDFMQPAPEFAQERAAAPQRTGFQLKYAGPDSDGRFVAIPLRRLFRGTASETLATGIDFPEASQARAYLDTWFTSSLRDIRRTYQRAFKALLFGDRFGLSARRIAAGDGQSELGYLLANPTAFAGVSYYRSDGGFTRHAAGFDVNFLPLRDDYRSPLPAQDDRVQPSPQRTQALFDWWERIFDYVRMRQDAEACRTTPAWLLFHEAQQNQPPDPSRLLRHLGIDLRHAGLLLSYFDAVAPGIRQIESPDLEDDRWAVRVWHGEEWIRGVLREFQPADITAARPFLWVADDPGTTLAGQPQSGNANLSAFVADGLFENGLPRRYEELQEINNGLRRRARDALVTFLCATDRVALPWGGHAQTPGDLSDLLLIDVEAGACERASRIEETTTAVQSFIRRARLGLEQAWVISHPFARLWDRRFATFGVWEACQRREIYKENWIEWEELGRPRIAEAFQFLESETGRAALTIAVPGGLEWWPDERPPEHPADHPAEQALQSREPARLQRLVPPREGLSLLGTPERDARPSWLAPLPDPGEQPDGPGDGEAGRPAIAQPPAAESVPYWMQAAINLGTRFYRVAAAGEPRAGQAFRPHRSQQESVCCAECGQEHPALVDEYYFWLTDSSEFSEPAPNPAGQANPQPYEDGYQVSYYDQATQESGLWQDESQLPQLLAWDPGPTVRLSWCRVHNGEFQQPRCSTESLPVQPGAATDLTFEGRASDSVTFQVTGAQPAPAGYADQPLPGFRFDLAADQAVALPLVAVPAPLAPPPPPPPPFLGVLPAYPYFVYHSPGAGLLPRSWYRPALAVACALRTHCRFEAALKWYQRAFDPLQNDCSWVRCPVDDEPAPPAPGPGQAAAVQADQPAAGQAGNGHDQPVRRCCDSTDITDATARDRSVLLLYLETMLQWGDALMSKDTPEAFAQARLLFDTASTILGPRPRSVLPDETGTPETVGGFAADWPALNPRLLNLYGLAADRRALIHACLDAVRRRNGRGSCELPYFGERPPPAGWRTGPGCRTEPGPCGDDTGWCLPHSPYRFLFLIQKAEELAVQVRELGGALLGAYEKGDAEYLASLRAGHERELLTLGLAVRQDQWRDADWQIQALQRTKAATQANLLYYNALIQNGLINNEIQYEEMTNTSMVTRAAGNIVQAIGEVMKIIPDLFVGFPCEEAQLPIGTKLGGVFESAGRIIDIIADVESTTASLDLTLAGWDRRQDEWIHQSQVLTIDVEQVERQILGAQRRRDQALRELNTQRRQIDQSAEVQDFLRGKFTAHNLYLYLQKETAALHRQMYELAVHVAREAERAFNIERGHTTRHFLPREPWDSLHEGLLAGERLHNALQHMEKAYLDENTREYELTKHLSLRLHFPAAYLQLRDRGQCEVCIPEWMFDLDYPGMYMRRIKNVTMTIPCVTGPYTGVHCRLTLLSSETRTDPRLTPPPHRCCSDRDDGDEYRLCADDPRAVRQYGALEAIATSSGQADSGMFEVSFRDDRYLPFEYAGAASRWRIELPQENNQFDLDTLSDVVLHLGFTAREGGELLRHAANETAQRHLPGAGVRFFDVRHELPDEWAALRSDVPGERPHRELPLRMSRGMFPFLPGRSAIRIHRLDLFFEAPGAEASQSRCVEFLLGHRPGHSGNEDCDCKRFTVECVASREWPSLFHGVLEAELPPLPADGYRDMGTFRFGHSVTEVSQAFLLCSYAATSQRARSGGEGLSE